MRTAALLSIVALLAACAGTPDRIAAPSVTPEGRVVIDFASLEVRDLSLPSYAQDDIVYVETAEGLIRPENGLRWADDPVRAGTLDLVRGLGVLTAGRIAGEPWPFDGYPDARLEVRIDRFLASRAQQAFRISGQYFVADLTGAGRDRSGLFDLSVPLPADFGPADIAAARSRILADLAAHLARDGLG